METEYFFTIVPCPVYEPKNVPGPRRVDYKAKTKARLHRKAVRHQKRHMAA